MKNKGWKYGAAIGAAAVLVIGGFGISVLASGKVADSKEAVGSEELWSSDERWSSDELLISEEVLASGEKNGTGIAAGTAGEVESIKVIKNVYQPGGEAETETKEDAAGNAAEGSENDGMDVKDAKTGDSGKAGAVAKGAEIGAGGGSAENTEEKDGERGKTVSGTGEKEENGEEAGDGKDTEEADAAAEENAAEIDAYFDDSVFVGDSIMLGFRNYAMKRQDTFLSRMSFLAAGSFSANNALWDVDDKSVHPVYQGQQRQVWESISLMGSKKAFLMLGMNDLNITGLEGSREKYEELIGKIKEKNPDTEIIIMSMTYVLKGKETGKLQNDTIREFNGMLQAMAEENGWGFVDVAEALADENGDLAEEYCSDGFAHQNPEAYDVWVSVLRKYADEHLELE